MLRPSLPAVFAAFFRLGLTAFGGPAMLPYIREMAVVRKGWLSEASYRMGMALCQSVPGATAMQVAAYVGLRARGAPGALAAYLGFGLPAFCLVCALSWLYVSFGTAGPVLSAFAGLKVVVVALVAHASCDFAIQYINRNADRFLAVAAGIWLGMRLNPIIILVACCLAALFLYRDIQPAPSCTTDSGPPPARTSFAVLALNIAVFAVGLGVLFALDRTLFDLGALMAKIDLFAFGGGYVSIPLMLHEVAGRMQWMTEAQFMDGIAMGQITPGPIVMTSAFVGWFVAGPAGAAVATVCAFGPSFLILTGLAPVGDRLRGSALFQRALRGSLVSLVGLMAAVTGRFALAADWSPAAVLLGLAAFLALRARVDILWVVPLGAAVSLLVL